ncbi:MAG TPA: LanC-like protein [Reyranella sp.]
MIDSARHIPLQPLPWDAATVSAAIDEIVADALTYFDGERFWPAHPLDNVKDGNSSFYFGAAGMIWGLDYLRRVGATTAGSGFGPVLARLLEKTQAEMATYGDYATNGSFLFGDLGTALVVMRLAPAESIADLVYERAEANMRLPVRELMWGTPGSMLACVHMAEMTDEPRWQALFAVQAERLLDDLEETPDGPLWTQDLYGHQSCYLGPVHGYAGNMLPLLRGWKWLTDGQRQRVSEATTQTLTANAWRSEQGVSWHAVTRREKPPHLCQHCHGAPGMVTTFAGAPFTSLDLESLLVEGGNFTWAAGPLAKGSNLCHGTGGNGYAFLKLHRRTGRPIWLEHARAFAMTAIGQCQQARTQLGRGRYSLWTGDVGLAVYLWDCLTAKPYFPTIDVF